MHFELWQGLLIPLCRDDARRSLRLFYAEQFE